MKKHYSVERLQDDKWISWIGAADVGLQYAKGFVDAIGQYYPCPGRRIVEIESGKIVETWRGNGTPRVN